METMTTAVLDEPMLERLDDDYLRWQVGAGPDRRVWTLPTESAVVVALPREIDCTPSYGLVGCGGPGEAVGSLLDAAAAELAGEGTVDIRVSVPPEVREHLPATLQPTGAPSAWEWWWTDTVPPVGAGVTWLGGGDLADVAALLSTHSPSAHAAPGDPDVLGWAGVRDAGRLVAAGAVVASAAGTAHLRAIVTVPDRRGRGLGSAVTAHLTRWGLTRSPRVTLGMYSDNAVARRVYQRLGYRGQRCWVSSGARLSTSASRPRP